MSAQHRENIMPDLVILGPNLPSGATFHVHSAGCRDLVARKYRGHQRYEEQHDCLQSIVEDFYADQIAEADPGTTWTSYTEEFDIFPCVGELPDLAPLPQPEPEVLSEADADLAFHQGIIDESGENIENSLPSDPGSDTVVPSKAVARKTKSNKEQSKVSTKTTTKKAVSRKSYNGNRARQVVARRNKGMSWAAIGEEFGFSPRTARAAFDSIKGEGAHYDSRLEGKGGRFQDPTLASAKTED